MAGAASDAGPVGASARFTRSVITDEISQDLQRAAVMAERHRLDQLEIRTAWDTRIDQMDADTLARVKHIARAHGLGIVALASPVFKCDLQAPDQLAAHIAMLGRCINAAHRLDARLIRVFTFWKRGELADHFDAVVERFHGPATLAEREGVVLAVENEPECYVGTGQELATLIAAVGSPAVRATWDPENAFRSGQANAVAAGYTAVRPFIAHVHLKDSRAGRPAARVKRTTRATHASAGRPPYSSCLLGAGDVGILAQLRWLAADGYAASVSLETHYRMAGSLAAADIAAPGGSAFSAGGEQATERCLIRWTRMMAALTNDGKVP